MNPQPIDQNIEDLKAMLLMTDELGLTADEVSTQQTNLDERIPGPTSIFSCPWDNAHGDSTYFR